MYRHAFIQKPKAPILYHLQAFSKWLRHNAKPHYFPERHPKVSVQILALCRIRKAVRGRWLDEMRLLTKPQ
jgi:hypothetical protein